ncbi:TRZ/ATZ family hydrolase [Guyparkeria halophila]|uniref:5-methylthioadenosine/S-adenosylhomocysteine deaminase n=1 Tax=Guyparkeria halophila TaxID=47960 RepID=A0ABZ0YYN9_9GAMM|nr:TRZ/ATZ family hydrolase [Guyparkeria halophila]WQH17166.1 TRZ/ATZ family hydrolase [Guyparkeria halophila]
MATDHSTQILAPRWLIPVAPRDEVLEDHAVWVADGRIEAILTREQAQHRRQASDHPVEWIDLPTHALIPGLVNGHTHAAMSLMRGLADDLPLMTWLEEHIWPVEGQMLGHDFVHDGTMLAALEMIRGGTTTLSDMYFFPEAAIEAVQAAGLRGVFGIVVIDAPNRWSANAEEALAKGVELVNDWRRHSRIEFTLAPHAPYTVGDAALERVRTMSDQLDLPVHMHVHETAHEVEAAVAANGERPLARLDRLGLVNERLIAVHMTQLTDAEIDRLAVTGSHVLHSPQSNLKLASGFCPVAKLLEAGVNVGLGTDGAASNNDLDMFDEMRTAALIAKPIANDAAAVSAHQALHMATLGGARAFGLDERIGSIEPGKRADLVAVNLDEPETQPVFDPVSTLVYSASRRQVSDVWVDGHALLRGGRLRQLDSRAIIDQANTWREPIRWAKPAG